MAAHWLKLYQQLQLKTNIKVVSCCDQYRVMAKVLPQPDETVLEIGSSSGLTTKVLAGSAKQVIAIDTSRSFIEESRINYAELSHVQFVWLDARDVPAVKDIVPEPHMIFMDIGGDAPLTNIASMLRLYLMHFSPRLLVVRNFELAIVHNLITEADIPSNDRRINALLNQPTDTCVQQLIDLSHSELLSDRIFAARKLRGISEKAARERLLEMSNDPSSKVRKICMHH